jgi:hypothetical protein
MKKNILFCLLLCLQFKGFGQPAGNNLKFSAVQLKEDLAFLKHQITAVHAFPYSELSKAGYEKLFSSIETRITDSATATDFYKLIKPAVAYLSDEHSQLDLSPDLQANVYKEENIFLPITLSRQGKYYVIDDILSENTTFKTGEIITKINDVPIAGLIQQCALYTTGFPGQRIQKAMRQFGYLYTWANPQIVYNFNILTKSGKSIEVKGVNSKTWQDYIASKTGETPPLSQRIVYTRYKDAGYVNARSFYVKGDADFNLLKTEIENIFKQVQKDNVKDLVIDVSQNEGGNSAVGDILIDYFYDKPYGGYQCNWKRSDEYLKLIKSWGMTNEDYAGKPVGDIIHFDSDTTSPGANPYRFKGRVYVVIGSGTFSSAIMFATIIKDNHIATLAGETPQNGHPNHFGEMYSTKLPNTKIALRFGVKEWIRPAGKKQENILNPDVVVDLSKNKTGEDLVKALLADR